MTETERLRREVRMLRGKCARLWLLADRLQPGIALRVPGYLDAHPDEAKR